MKELIDRIDTIILKALDMRIKELEENFKILESRVDDLEDDIGRIKRG